MLSSTAERLSLIKLNTKAVSSIQTSVQFVEVLQKFYNLKRILARDLFKPHLSKTRENKGLPVD